MPRVEIVAGKKSVSFLWGTLGAGTTRIVDIGPAEIAELPAIQARGYIKSWRALDVVDKLNIPVTADVAAANSLGAVYAATFGKALVGGMSREELSRLYETYVGKKVGKKGDKTLLKELGDALGS
jgi:hypothetical protein